MSGVAHADSGVPSGTSNPAPSNPDPSDKVSGEITPEALEALPSADVVVLGEVHDNPDHHANQARAVAALRPKALVFEMLTPDQLARLGEADRRDAQTLEAALDWQQSGWPDFAMYWPIFAAAPEARLFAGGVDRQDARRAVKEGAATFFGADAGRYGLDQPLAAPLQAELEAQQMQAHCNAMPAAMMPGMVEVQRLRDAALAGGAIQAMAETGGPVVVIAGSGHARADLGVPAVLGRAAPELRVLSVGQLERGTMENATGQSDVAAPSEEAPPFDLWIASPAVAREDPCLSLTGG